MALSIQEIKERISEHRHRDVLTLAQLHQNRLRLHCQSVPSTPALAQTYRVGQKRPYDLGTFMGREGVTQALGDFLGMVEKLIPHDKFVIFQTLFRFPVKTNEVMSEVFDKLSRIFEGRNPAFSYQFATTEQRDDWEWYRQEKLGEPAIWSTKGWEFFQTEINSVMIVDLPVEQEAGDRYPQPYFYWLPLRDVVEYKADKTTGQMSYIIFRQKDNKLAVIDDESYRIFESKDDMPTGEPLIENRHDLGYCPARFFWSEPMSLEFPDIKRSPVTKALDNLDWFLFFSISKRHLDLYGSYPIYSGYEQDCNFHNDNTGDYCDGGFLKNRKGEWLWDANGLVPCPKCHDHRITGAGSFVEVPVPIEGQPDLRHPVDMLTVDRASLDYNVEEEKRLRSTIITSIVGQNEEVTQREAVNEQQIKANFESQATVLNRVKKGFEEAQKWVDDTCCRLRYGTLFLSSSVSYGTEFYLFSTDELRERYKTAKETGMSESELDALHQQIIETEYRNNPQQLQRMLILAELEPYRHLTRNEVANLYQTGIVSVEDYLVKLNFADFIRRFERENMNIIEFGSATAYDTKITTIKEQLRAYAQEIAPDTKPQQQNNE